MSKRLVILLAGLTVLAGQIALAADDRSAWQEPFALTLPETTRTIALRPGTDAAGFLTANGLEDARVIPLGGRGSLVEVAADDESWQALSDRVCSSPDVTSCDSAVCQGIQLSGSAAPGSAYGVEAVQARLVHNPPESAELPDPPEGEAGTCQGPPIIPPLDQAAGAAGPGQNLTIDLTLLDSDGGAKAATDPGSTTETSAGAEVAATDADAAPGAADAPPARRPGFQFSLRSRFNPSGGLDLGTDELPADTTDWTLVVGAGCTEVKVPLSAVEPARTPGIVVALVDGGNVNAVAATYGLAVLRQIGLTSTGQNLVVYATAQNVFAVIAAMAGDGRVDGAQPEYVYQTTAEVAQPTADTAGTYSDPFAVMNYGPGMTGALALHGSAKGKGQLIAVIDTGVDVSHPDLAGRLREPVDTTEKGYAAEVHGTAVAGIIAAEADNAIGSYGVAPAAEILPIKACHPKAEGGLAARCTTSSLVQAMDVAMVADAKIINMSLAGPPDELLARFVALAVRQDRLIVAGAGNGGEHGKPGFPAALPGVLAVTAVDVANRLYAEANRGEYIDVAAPGVDIVSSAPEGQYPPLSGTSMAAAHVTGIAALIRELGPLLGSREIGLVLKSNARDLGATGADAVFGAGVVDACQAASAATASAVSCATGEKDDYGF